MRDKYAAIHAERAQFSVRLMCAALGVSPSGYYAAQGRQRRAPSARAQGDARLRLVVRTVFRETRGRYGAPRIHDELTAAGERTSEKRVARLMREDGLVARRRRRFIVTTTDSEPAEPVAPNLLARDFSVGTRACNTAWVSDLTYVPTREGFLYLAVVLDLASRRVVGWALGDTLETALPVAALRRAIRQRQPDREIIHHSDRGSQYASRAYRAVLAQHGFRVSMSRKGDCWDNAVAESFFATLEHELLALDTFATKRDAQHALFEFIEVWYNRQRRHTSLGSISPAQFEAHHRAA
jgi:transposase InsO family protein